jgi:hypothetical protein
VRYSTCWLSARIGDHAARGRRPQQMRAPPAQRRFLDDFRLAFNTSACLRYASARLERLAAASASDIARAILSAFLACSRKNLVSFTIAAPNAGRECQAPWCLLRSA